MQPTPTNSDTLHQRTYATYDEDLLYLEQLGRKDNNRKEDIVLFEMRLIITLSP